MPNHWHLVLRPAKDRQMGRLLRWVTGTHALGYRTHYHNLGGGHLYQGRFKSFAIGDDCTTRCDRRGVLASDRDRQSPIAQPQMPKTTPVTFSSPVFFPNSG